MSLKRFHLVWGLFSVTLTSQSHFFPITPLKWSLRWLKNVCNVVCLFFSCCIFFVYSPLFFFAFYCLPLNCISSDSKICEGQRLFLYQTKQQLQKKVMTLYLPWINKFYNVLGVSSHVVSSIRSNVVVIIVVVATTTTCSPTSSYTYVVISTRMRMLNNVRVYCHCWLP